MLPLFIIAQVSAVAAQHHAHSERQRIAAGLPPPVQPPPKTTLELAKEKREDFIAACCLWGYLILCGAVFCAPPCMLIYCAIKIAFARQGVKWP